jgi:TolB protein
VDQQLDILPRIRRPYFAVTADGRRMTYVSGRQSSNLWLIEPGVAGSPPLRTALTSGTALRWGPVVSSDGRWIGFAEEKARGAAELFRMPLDGGTPLQLTFGAHVRQPSQIAWSPDGSQMVFVSQRGGRVQLWIASVQGGQIHALTGSRPNAVLSQLTWAPGVRIAYQSEDHGIVMLDPESGEERALFSDTTLRGMSPRYSPDGSRLAVSSRAKGARVDAGISVVDLQGSAAKRLPVPGERFWPTAWSPDARYIYVQARPSGSLYRLDVGGSRPPERVVDMIWRDSDCVPAGPRRPKAFVCAAFDFVSDVWMIENFDSSKR